jgi:uncharacterized Fe-S cluster protein YjdI/CDGSH-type Zn-finger protein
MSVRSYEGDGIVVHWNAEVCEHSEHCFRTLPAVFDPKARPWISPTGTAADAVAAAIDGCPSGALTYTRLDGAALGPRGVPEGDDPAQHVGPLTPPSTAGAVVTITPREDGPLVVSGLVGLRDPDGQIAAPVERMFLCRCGGSSTKPLCDGTHKRNGFRADGVPVPRKP